MRRKGLLATGTLMLLVAASCSREKHTPPVISDELRAVSVVPDPKGLACAECHEDIVKQWIRSQHAQANRLVSEPDDAAAFKPSATVRHGSFETTMTERGGETLMFSSSFSNQPAQHFAAEAVIGVTPLRQYLVPFPGGRLQTVDLAYDPRSNEWFNVFGDENRQPHEWGFWQNRSMTWNVQCAFCHMTGFEKNYDLKTDRYASTWKAMGISCAQCHTMRETGSEPAGPGCPAVVTPDPASRSASMDNCASCHARREELFGTFKPGDQFHDHFRLTLPDAPGIFYADGQVREEDFEYASFMMSRMGHKGVTCLDCHNPHSGDLVAPYENDALCLRCHAPPGQNGATPVDPLTHSHHQPGTPGGRCVDCHMPVHYYMVRDGRRDHGFTSPDPRLTIEHGIPNACTMCHTDESPEWAEQFTTEWYGDKMNRRSRERARVVARAHEGDDTVGPALLEMAQGEEIAAWRAALDGLLAGWVHTEGVVDHLTGELTHASPLVRSAAVRALQDVPGIEPLLTATMSDTSALVRIDAAWLASTAPSSTTPSLRELQRYLDHVSDQPGGALRQAQLAIAEDRLEEAESWAVKAATWDPSAAPRYALGRIQHLQGNLLAASSNMAAAALSETNNAEYSFAVALLCSETGQDATALAWLEETVRRDPSFGRGWYNLGLAYAQAERLQDAVRALGQAVTSSPGSPEPPYALATVHAREGRWRDARMAAQRALTIAPDYTPALRIMAQAEAELGRKR